MLVAVTGGTGFIGSHTTAALVKAGHAVRLLVRDPGKTVRVFAAHGLTIDDFVVGGEHAGVPEGVLAQCDAVVRIPMAGFIRSYNLQAAVAMIAAERMRQEQA